MSDHVARARSERGEIVLSRRDAALELRVNGVFVMDTAHTDTERLLATATLAQVHRSGGLDVLIGGLGLGFTLREVLGDPRVRSARVAEIEPDLVDWHRRGLVPDTAGAVADERVTIAVGDVADVLAATPADSVDVVLLDVDNGPGYLVYDGNADLYRRDFLALCRARLRPGGTLAVWSADTSPELSAALDEVFGDSRELAVPVTLDNRETTYHVFLATRE
ncbi:spermidine synthase [Saccharopolyspora rosea]|uniref:Spermidine synthase n=1 Tax=Saccharopolyspora rosea TaxID=524884 RepID=A0ABW3FUV7_9PSEU|nr:hypothetical protein [Saccharopolyspora rosea]